MNLHELYDKELKFIERIEKLYVYLEHIKVKDAKLFSESGKANLRRAQSELQHMRLLLYDILETGPQRETLHNSIHNTDAKTNNNKNIGASAQASESIKNVINELDQLIATSDDNGQVDELKELRQRLQGTVILYESRFQKTVRIEILLRKRSRLHERMLSQWNKYKKAIDDRKSLAETNEIYLRIKDLQAKADEITAQIHETLQIGN